MKNTKIMAVLVVLLAAMLFVGAASAANDGVTLTLTPSQTEVIVGEEFTVNVTVSELTTLDTEINVTITYGDQTQEVKIPATSQKDAEVMSGPFTAAIGVTDISATADPNTGVNTIDSVDIAVKAQPITVKLDTTDKPYDGQTIVVNVSGKIVSGAKINVTYGDDTKQISEIPTSGFATVPFNAKSGEDTITIENDKATEGTYSIDPATLPITVSDVSQLQVGTSADNAPKLENGYFRLTDKNGAALDEGITFTSATGKKLVTQDTGVVLIDGEVESGLYQYNGYYINVETTKSATALTLSGDNAVTAEDTYTLTINAGGDYVGKTATINWGDGTTPEPIVLVDGEKDASHTYEEAKLYKIDVTANGKSFNKTITVLAGDRKVNTTLHDAAFVYETVRVVDGNGEPVTKLYFYSSDATPALIATLASETGTYELLEAAVNGHYGAWYAEPMTNDGLSPNYITIWYPEMSLKAELTSSAGDSIDGKTINKNTEVSFFIEAPNVGPAGIAAAKIVFTTPAGGKTTTFGGEDFANIPLKSVQTLAGSTNAGTDATAGAWTAQAEYTSPAGFKDNAGKLKTNTISFTLKSTTLSITADKDSVIRSNPFTVTISGDSKTPYEVFIDGADRNDVNPSILANQSGYQAGSSWTDNYGNVIGAVFETDAAGARTVQFNTASDTEDQTYTIRVEKVSDRSDYDKVDVKVEKGAITISASGDGSYYIGEEIKLTGTNTDSKDVFLFVTGPNLDFADGVVLKDLPVQKPAYSAANPVSVNTDNTWEYKWDTKLISLDAGAYTVYATSRLTNGKSSGAVQITKETNSKYDVYGMEIDGSYYAVKLSDSEYATVSINLKKPFLSAVPSGTVVAKGDKIYIRGTAEGNPSYLQLYIFGPNFYQRDSITVEDDGTYEKKIEVGSDWASNQYYVVIEHPMENGYIDVEETSDGTTLYIPNADDTFTSQSSFIVKGTGKLQSANAANALTTMIDNANIDDIYTKLTFTVAEPSITITNPGDQGVGTKFTISGKTNLAVDDQILVEVVSSSFNPVDKTQSSSTSGVSMTTKVVAGDGVENTWSVEVDTTNWKLDEYTIKATGIEVDVTATTNFNLVEKAVVTPTATATGATPTTTATATATTAPTQTPGFGAFVALAGLGAVALLVLRRN